MGKINLAISIVYAKALFKLSDGSMTAIERWLSLLDSISKMLSNKDMMLIYFAPVHSLEDKFNLAIAYLEDALKIKLNEEEHNLLDLLIRSKRIFNSDSISSKLRQLASSVTNRATAVMYIPEYSDDSYKNILKLLFEGMLSKELDITYYSRSNILGGVICVISDMVYDLSLNKDLNSIKNTIAANI